ncbi:hypothetical protein GCM10011609_76950 [Lentzea pudingi]|uniref:Uncharacterized protein n=1 Tax=Lentzea pudingi TaxID=1789439 RepID=A0ABQ2INU8_9PSEU|nr:hypothetical protein GCM10011609_76950 [Lentzea pudingi]
MGEQGRNLFARAAGALGWSFVAPLAAPPDDGSPESLFEQISDTDYRCTRCGATNTCESDSFPSFGGTTEWWERCTACGAGISGCDMSAVL